MSSQPAHSTPLTIAVVKPCCIGDCVMALPAIESLAQTFPYAHIHAFAGRHAAAVFRASPHVSRVYISPDQLSPSRVAGMAWNLRTAGHDWIVALDRSRLLTAAARSAAPARLVTLSKSKDPFRHETDIYLDAVASAGVKTTDNPPRIDVSADAVGSACVALNGVEHPIAVLHPGGAENPGSRMPDKRWPAERFAEIARYLSHIGVQTVLTGGPGDTETSALVTRVTPDVQMLDLSGKLSLIETAAVIERAALYVGADTGVSHLASAVATPTIAIFGPTNPLRYAPRGPHVSVLAPDAAYLLPDVDLRRTSQTGGRPSTSEVSVATVEAAIDELLATVSVVR